MIPILNSIVAARLAEFDDLLARIARDRAEAWAHSPAGTQYDNTPIREAARLFLNRRRRRRKQGTDGR
jgi:hypothetical protein